MGKYVKRGEDYLSVNPVDVYKLVICGKLGKFPNNFLDKEAIKEIFRYLVLDIYHFNREDICQKITQEFMSSNYLGNARKFFDMQNYKIIEYSFPELNILPWECSKVHPKFWDDPDNQKNFVIWSFEKLGLDYNSKEDIRKYTAAKITKLGGSSALKAAGGVYELICTVTGNKYKPWEITKMQVWTREQVIDAIYWLVEEKLHCTYKSACSLTSKDFKEYNLDGMLQRYCEHSVLNALNLAYGSVFYRKGNSGIKVRTKK